ncbi:hypothetical protein BCR35DRAFT_305397 [Leucosporidium creatinivorum]|uniref:Nudix hydrolase domain-containing protein n=1 Tax=Leucosporidium creatinivorum TaxID=106004 RepID=A0A1Y2F172_9BASI|nr:hypothetical protein BCR35DRAFT_305397 [Leucosporidium creatinivorum]
MSTAPTPVPRPEGNYNPLPPSPADLEARKEQLNRVILSLGTSLSPSSALCLRNLLSFQADPASISFPKAKLAGVLVLLHVDEQGELGVTLTTRSLRLRSHPGETALPGGGTRWLREANEEISLPLQPTSSLLHLTTLPAFTSRTLLIVIPSVYLLTTHPASTVLENLVPNPEEVDAIFQVKLREMLGLPPVVNPDESAEEASALRRSTRSNTQPAPPPPSSLLQHSYSDHIWLRSTLYRLHLFSSPSLPSPISGLTADILITVALLGYHGFTESEETGRVREKEVGVLGFERWAEGQLSWREIVEEGMRLKGFKGLLGVVRTDR